MPDFVTQPMLMSQVFVAIPMNHYCYQLQDHSHIQQIHHHQSQPFSMSSQVIYIGISLFFLSLLS
jgi:hypothetical protein